VRTHLQLGTQVVDAMEAGGTGVVVHLAQCQPIPRLLCHLPVR
jgi:hypothetical protein